MFYVIYITTIRIRKIFIATHKEVSLVNTFPSIYLQKQEDTRNIHNTITY